MKIEKIFSPDQFTPTEWDTAQDKADFANRFVAFAKSDFPQEGFTKKFYQRLSNTFGHIAHYNQGGFWDVWFSSDVAKLQFLEHTFQHQCYGDPRFTYSDVERAVKLKVCHLIDTYRRRVEEETETAERAELARLQAKYSA